MNYLKLGIEERIHPIYLMIAIEILIFYFCSICHRVLRISDFFEMAKYCDSQQLFIGNLPLQCTEEDLSNLFSKFGNILEVRAVLKKKNM